MNTVSFHSSQCMFTLHPVLNPGNLRNIWTRNCLILPCASLWWDFPQAQLHLPDFKRVWWVAAWCWHLNTGLPNPTLCQSLTGFATGWKPYLAFLAWQLYTLALVDHRPGSDKQCCTKAEFLGGKGEIFYIWLSLLITFNLVLGWRRTEKQWNWDQPKNKRTSEGIGDRQNAEIRNLESES